MQRQLTIALSILLLVACANAGAAPAGTAGEAARPGVSAVPPPIDVTLVAEHRRILAVADGVAGPRVDGIVGMDGQTVLTAESGELVWRDGVGGAVSSRIGRVDDVVPLVTDLDGRYVALGPPPADAAPGTIAPGRTETTIVVLSSSGDEHRVTLAGNVVPEAFSTELGTGRAPFVFLLEYLPAEAPTHYRVRVLDPVSGQLSWPFNLRDKTQPVDTEMAGISRDQVVAADRGLLFTLYRGHHAGEGTDYAFVHVLGMAGGVWCLAVPTELDLATVPGAVAVSPDESTLYVASANGLLATYDIDAVLDAERDPSASRVGGGLPGGDERPALTVAERGPIVAQGGTVVWLDTDLLRTAEVRLDATVTALGATSGDEVIAAAGGGLVALTAGGAGGAVVALPEEVGRVSLILPD